MQFYAEGKKWLIDNAALAVNCIDDNNVWEER